MTEFETSGPWVWIRLYFDKVKAILTRPSQFFRNLSPESDPNPPIVFALVTHWLGTAMEYFWNSLIGRLFSERLADLTKIMGDVADIDQPGQSVKLIQFRDQVLHWLWGMGRVIADPFLHLVSILFTSFFVYAGARLLIEPGRDGAPEKIRYHHALQIVCYASAASILSSIPVVGSTVAWIGGLILMVVGARETFRTSTGRSLVVAFFPKILLAGVFVTGFFFLFLFIAKALTQFF
ncbi:MAG: YIP1 family protein [Bdellovibrionales bacterium]|nr:YIP1 family protein [Bdellovibrionales bacterium]